jgi:hypothetical protein
LRGEEGVKTTRGGTRHFRVTGNEKYFMTLDLKPEVAAALDVFVMPRHFSFTTAGELPTFLLPPLPAVATLGGAPSRRKLN